MLDFTLLGYCLRRVACEALSQTTWHRQLCLRGPLSVPGRSLRPHGKIFLDGMHSFALSREKKNCTAV